MNILVTGGCGFIGSHLCDALLAAGHHVTALDDLSTGKRENLNASAQFVHMDVRDPALEEVFAALKPKAVYHQAAQISVPRSVSLPGHDADVNLLGTINLLERCKAHGAKLIFASSAAVYGAPEYLGLDEAHPTRPLSPYGMSKLAAEGYIALYGRLYGLDYTILRYANVYGPRQDAGGEGGVVAVFAQKARQGQAPVIFGDGRQSRDFVHVRDVAAANLAALAGGSRETLNVGTGRAVGIGALSALMSGLPPRFEAARAGDIAHSYFSIKKIGRTLGFAPRIELETGLAELLRGGDGRQSGRTAGR